MTSEQVVGLATDEEFKDIVGYCRIHCKTERALFHKDHINKMLLLAGVDACCECDFASMHGDMLELCDKACKRRNDAKRMLQEAAQWKQHLDCLDHLFPTD